MSCLLRTLPSLISASFLMHNQKLSLQICNVIVMIIIYCKRLSDLVLLIKDFTYISPSFTETLIDAYVYL